MVYQPESRKAGINYYVYELPLIVTTPSFLNGYVISYLNYMAITSQDTKASPAVARNRLQYSPVVAVVFW